MKDSINRTMWLVVALVVALTIGTIFGSKYTHSQENGVTRPSPTQPLDKKGLEEYLSKFPIVDYNEGLPESALARDERTVKNQRYDNRGWVQRNPHPDTAKIGLDDESIQPPEIPTDESDLILVGNVVSGTAHISNDKSGVYTEFAVKIGQVMKNDTSRKIQPGFTITVDRAGGVVRYPNGQKVLYAVSGKGLLSVGSEYLFFLADTKTSGNYEIVNLYELLDGSTDTDDNKRSVDEINRRRKADFIKRVQDKVGNHE